MADQSTGASIADAYRTWTPDAAAPASAGASIADAYRTQQGTDTPPPATSGSWFPAPPAFDEYGRPLPTIQSQDVPGIISLEDLRSQIQQADINALKYMAPDKDAGPIETFARKVGMTGVHLAAGLAQAPVNLLLGISHGGGPGGLTYNPQTGALNLTPEAMTVAQFGASPLRFGGPLKPQFGPPAPAPQFGPPSPPPPAFVPPNTSNVPLPPRVVGGGEAPAMIPPRTTIDPVTGETVPVQQPPNLLQPQPSTAAPASAVPSTTAPTEAPRGRITPITTQAQAEAEADRIIRHFAGDHPVVINSAPLASGAQPTLSQSIEGGHGGLAGLERGVRDVPEQTQHFVARETANTTLRNKAVGDVIGDPRATDVAEAELNTRTRPQEAAIFDPARTTPVDPSDAIATLDRIRAGPAGQRDAVAEGLDHLRGKLIDKDGNMQTDPAQLRGVDLAIKDMISPKAASTKQDFRAAAHELMAVRDVLRDNIEQGAPGYKDFLASQAAERSAIDGQRFLQARNITDRNGNVNLGTLDSTIKAAEQQQRLPGARLADGVTDEQLDALRRLRADYQNDAKQRLGTSLGSPTVQKLGVSGSMGVMGHPLLAGGVGTAGAWLAGINPLLGTTLAGAGYLLKQQSAKGQRMVMDALRDKLLNPERAKSAFPSTSGSP